MKRALLALFVFAAGAASYFHSRQRADEIQKELAAQAATLVELTQKATRLQTEQQELSAHMAETKNLFSALPLPAPADALARKILGGATWKNLSAAESERLLAELGFNWNSSGEFLFLNKSSVEKISFAGLKGTQLSQAALEILAISPAEKESIESMARRLTDAQAAWMKEHLTRTEPHGEVVAEYSLPPDADFSAQQLADFTNTLATALDPQRAQWLQDHAGGWMMDFGLRQEANLSKVSPNLLALAMKNLPEAEPTRLTITSRTSGGTTYLDYTLQDSGSTISLRPWQPFPQAFRAAFPGGWPDVFAHENIPLPKELEPAK